jgi:hypothetical protein
MVTSYQGRALAFPVAALLVLVTSPARADPALPAPEPEPAPTPAPAPPRLLGAHLDADLDLGAPMGLDESRLSYGVGGRFGWRFQLGPAWIQPEGGGHYTAFRRFVIERGCAPCQFLVTEHPARAFGGLRIGGGVGESVLEPALFGHAGYGWVTTGFQGSDAVGVPSRVFDRSGPAFDAGVAIDVKLLRHLGLGVHGAYNVIVSSQVSPFLLWSGAVRWISYGIHVGGAL